MSKIEKRHDDELRAILEDSSLQKLEEIYANLSKDALTDTPEILDELEEKIKQASEITITALESLELKIDKNHERRLRFQHVGSINYKVGKTKSQEFGDFLTRQHDTPEEALLKNEFLGEIGKSLNSLPYRIRTAFITYNELGYFQGHENFTNLVLALKAKGVKTSDKTAKRHINTARKHLSNLCQRLDS